MYWSVSVDTSIGHQRLVFESIHVAVEQFGNPSRPFFDPGRGRTPNDIE